MTTTKKVLIGAGVVAAVAIVIGFTVYQSKKGVVEVQTGKVARLDLASTVTASGEITVLSLDHDAPLVRLLPEGGP